MMPSRPQRQKHRSEGPMGGDKGRGRGGGSVGFRMDKKLGQHLLKNPGVLDKICSAALIKSSDVVLEIGPGTGNLTMRLLPIAKKVICFDVDPRMVNEVKKRAFSMGLTNLVAMEGDALRADFGRFDVCTANLPYQISSPFVFRLLAHRPLFRCAVLMFQKEFAERLIAAPSTPAYCRLSVNVQLFCRIESVCKVAAGSFSPPPKVDSMVVKLSPKDPQPRVNFLEWDGLIRICFHRKNKTLRAAFKTASTLRMLEENHNTWRALTGEQPSELPFKDLCLSALEEVNLLDKRAISLPLETFFELLLAFNKRGIHFVSPKSQAATDNPFAGADEFSFVGMDVDT